MAGLHAPPKRKGTNHRPCERSRLHPSGIPLLLRPMLSTPSAKILSALTGALAVGFGAFGAHALKALLEESGRTGTWETATLYHLVHSAVLLFLAHREPWKDAAPAWITLFLGVLIFSGSLYLLCLTQVTWLGAITPIGGVLLITGWLLTLRRARTA